MSADPEIGQFAKKKGEIILREHKFDGIQEFDQSLPNWWLFTFYAAIVFFVGYWFIYYGTSLIKSPQLAVQEQIIAVQANQIRELNKLLAKLNDAQLVHIFAKDPLIVAAGQATFTKNCVPCHGVDLSATQDDGHGKKIPLPGLPLTDHNWKFTDKPMGLFNLINKGSPPESNGNNGARMEAWGAKLSPMEIAQVLSYVISKVPEDFKDIPKPEAN
ncbi:MAG: c-type cytochrome [Verrucomicrobia bacterium]|nr:MAG: c-type cytochrome [Verrucomicrobiota bacterium]